PQSLGTKRSWHSSHFFRHIFNWLCRHAHQDSTGFVTVLNYNTASTYYSVSGQTHLRSHHGSRAEETTRSKGDVAGNRHVVGEVTGLADLRSMPDLAAMGYHAAGTDGGRF